MPELVRDRPHIYLQNQGRGEQAPQEADAIRSIFLIAIEQRMPLL